MNLWIKTQPKTRRAKPRRFWLLALGQRIMALWARLSARGTYSGFEDKPAPSPAIAAAEDSATEPLSALPRPDDPLQHWMELVREKAPELLIPPEEGGTPWQTASDAMGLVPDQPTQETAPWPEHDGPVEDLQQNPGPVPAAPSAVHRIGQFAQRQASISGSDKPSSQAQVKETVLQAAPRDVSTKTAVQLPEQRGKVSIQNRRQEAHSAVSSLSGSEKTHTADLNKSPIGKKPVQTLSAKETGKFRQLPKNDGWLQTPSRDQTHHNRTQRTAKQPSPHPVLLSSSKQMAPTSVTRAALVESNLSYSAESVSRIPNLPGIEDRKSGKVDFTSGRLRKLPGTGRSPELPQSNRALSAQENLLWQEAVPALQPMQRVDEWPTLEVDPWPELPENPPSVGEEWMEALHGREHVRALDFEQQGGGQWSE